jgi:hypothetical protein
MWALFFPEFVLLEGYGERVTSIILAHYSRYITERFSEFTELSQNN